MHARLCIRKPIIRLYQRRLAMFSGICGLHPHSRLRGRKDKCRCARKVMMLVMAVAVGLCMWQGLGFNMYITRCRIRISYAWNKRCWWLSQHNNMLNIFVRENIYGNERLSSKRMRIANMVVFNSNYEYVRVFMNVCMLMISNSGSVKFSKCCMEYIIRTEWLQK